MANAYSIIRRQQPYIQAVDVEDIRRTMAVKQQNYDYNVAQVNQAIANFGSIDLIRQEDRKYLYDNLKQVIDTVDNTDGLDFSKAGLGSQLSGHISKAIDTRVLKQARNTMAIRKFDATLEELKKDNPELYSSINEKDARYLSGYYQYMNGESDKLGPMSYTPFSDVEGKMIEHIKTLKDIYPDYEIEVPDPSNPGYMIKKKVSQLNSVEWNQTLSGSLSAVDRSQLAINARHQLGYSDEAAIKMLDSFKGQISEEYDSLIKIKKAELLGADEATTNSLNVEIKELEKLKTAALAKLPKGKTAGEIGGFFLEEKMIGGYANTLAKELFLGMTMDKAYFENLEAMENSGSLAGGLDSNKDGSIDVQEVSIPYDTEDGIGNLLGDFERQNVAATEKLKSDLMSVYNGLNTNYREEIDLIEQSIIQEYTKKTGKSPEEFTLHRMVVEEAARRGILEPHIKKDLLQQIDNVDAYSNAKKEALIKATENVVASNSRELYKELSENNGPIFGLPKGTISYAGFLKEKGIKNHKSLAAFINTDSEEARVLKANLLIQSDEDMSRVRGQLTGDSVKNFIARNFTKAIDKVISKAPVGEGALRAAAAPTIHAMSKLMYEGEVGQQTLDKIKVAAKLLGEDPREAFTNPESRVSKIIKSSTIDDSLLSGAINKITGPISWGLNPGRATSLLLGKSIAGLPNPTQPFGDVDQILGKDFLEEYERNLNLSSAGINSQNMLVVSGKNGKYDVPLHAEVRNIVSPFADIKNNEPLQLVRQGDGSVVVYQSHEYSESDSGEKSFKLGKRVGTIGATDITPTNTPHLYRYMEFQDSEGSINYLTKMRSSVGMVQYSNDSAVSADSLGKLFNKYSPQGQKLIARQKQMIISL
jgi:hypothetical protein